MGEDSSADLVAMHSFPNQLALEPFQFIGFVFIYWNLRSLCKHVPSTKKRKQALHSIKRSLRELIQGELNNKALNKLGQSFNTHFRYRIWQISLQHSLIKRIPIWKSSLKNKRARNSNTHARTRTNTWISNTIMLTFFRRPIWGILFFLTHSVNIMVLSPRAAR